MNPVQIDTTQAATDTISYVATDQNGLTSTTTRAVIIEAAPSDDASIDYPSNFHSSVNLRAMRANP